jgi:hypothetical protein
MSTIPTQCAYPIAGRCLDSLNPANWFKSPEPSAASLATASALATLQEQVLATRVANADGIGSVQINHNILLDILDGIIAIAGSLVDEAHAKGMTDCENAAGAYKTAAEIKKQHEDDTELDAMVEGLQEIGQKLKDRNHASIEAGTAEKWAGLVSLGVLGTLALDAVLVAGSATLPGRAVVAGAALLGMIGETAQTQPSQDLPVP